MKNILIKKKSGSSSDFIASLRETKVIPAVSSAEKVERIIAAREMIVFVLFGDILTIPEIITKFKDAGKTVLVHLDLIEGLSSRDVAVDFIAKNTHADGILSTKANLLKYAKNHGLLTIQRFFVLDSMAILNIERHMPLDYADAIEILPGLMPKIITRLSKLTNKPIIAGGLVSDQDDVQTALNAGAVAVSTTKSDLLQNIDR